eukprot:2555438-Pleurochrysis_carterae.AAC.2
MMMGPKMGDVRICPCPCLPPMFFTHSSYTTHAIATSGWAESTLIELELIVRLARSTFRRRVQPRAVPCSQLQSCDSTF